MAEDKKKYIDNQYDVFVVNGIFPDADKIFATQMKSLKQIKDSALIVLDTNALLVPYNIGKESLKQIKQTYQILVSQNRLFVLFWFRVKWTRATKNKSLMG